MNIKFQQLSFRYQNRFIIKKVNHKFESGAIHFIKGGNGAGKTTFLKLIATILKPTYGNIFYDNLESKELKKRKKISYISYLASLYPELTLKENINLFSKINNKNLDNYKNFLKIFNLESFENIETKKFSTGMLKKSSLIVSLMHDSDIYLFDEPFSGLDVDSVEILKKYIIELSKKDKMIFLVSHLLKEINNSKYYLIENEKFKLIS